MHVDGACHCGAIAWEAEVDPSVVSACHCHACQTLTGTVFRLTVNAAERDLRFTRGTPKIYRKPADSGRIRLQGFCGDCGSQIFATSEEDPARPGQRVFGLRIGALAQREAFVPTRHIWTRTRLPWLPEMPGTDESEH